jgi:hypothetical protein
LNTDDRSRAQVARLREFLARNPNVAAVLERGPRLDLPSWYLGAGAITQTVWNQLHGFEPASGIKDYDLVYFDAADLRIETESEIEAEVADRLGGRGIVVDVKNEARVHLWYEQRFGRHLEPYRSTGDAIATWPTTASSVGVRYDGHTFVVCAPFGLADLISMVARANKTIVTRDVYEEKVARWAAQWPQLTVIPW